MFLAIAFGFVVFCFQMRVGQVKRGKECGVGFGINQSVVSANEHVQYTVQKRLNFISEDSRYRQHTKYFVERKE